MGGIDTSRATESIHRPPGAFYKSASHVDKDDTREIAGKTQILLEFDDSRDWK